MSQLNDLRKSGGGLGFVGALTILFIALKLTEEIDWSWWWVLSPIWIEASLIIVLAIIVVLFKAGTRR